MEMNEAQRADLARRVAELRLSRYRGSRKAAYMDAGVNSATWSRIEAGQSVKEGSVVAVLIALWPETMGDWRRLDPPLGGEGAKSTDGLLAELERSDLHPKSKQMIREVLEAQRPSGSERGETA